MSKWKLTFLFFTDFKVPRAYLILEILPHVSALRFLCRKTSGMTFPELPLVKNVFCLYLEP